MYLIQRINSPFFEMLDILIKVGQSVDLFFLRGGLFAIFVDVESRIVVENVTAESDIGVGIGPLVAWCLSRG